MSWPLRFADPVTYLGILYLLWLSSFSLGCCLLMLWYGSWSVVSLLDHCSQSCNLWEGGQVQVCGVFLLQFLTQIWVQEKLWGVFPSKIWMTFSLLFLESTQASQRPSTLASWCLVQYYSELRFTIITLGYQRSYVFTCSICPSDLMGLCKILYFGA